MKKITLIMLVAMIPFLTMGQKGSKRASKSTSSTSTEKAQASNASYEFMIITGYVTMPPRSKAKSGQLNSADVDATAMMKLQGKLIVAFDFGGLRSEESTSLSEKRYKSMANAVNSAANFGWEFVSSNTQLMQGGITSHYYYMRRQK